MKTNWLKIAIALLTIIVAFPLQAQKLIKKELQTENESKDGFEYKWNKYTFVDGKDTLKSAFNLNNERITPNEAGVVYVGGGIFQVYSKDKNPFGRELVSGYNVNGELVFPKTKYWMIYYDGNGYFFLYTNNALGQNVIALYDYKGKCIISENYEYVFTVNTEDKLIECSANNDNRALFDLNGNCIISEAEGFDYFRVKNNCIFAENFKTKNHAVYNMNGSCIIPKSFGYTWIAYYDEYECFWCSKENSSGDSYDKRSYSKDGKYYAEGYCYKDEFQKKKRLVPNRSSYASSNAKSASTSSSSNNSASNSSANGLLYEGNYNFGPDVYPDGTSFTDAFGSSTISIFEDEIYLMGQGKFSFSGITNGQRKYTLDSDRYLYVDSNFNITYYKYVHNIGTITKKYTRTDSSSYTPSQNSNNYFGNGGSDSHTHDHGTSQPSTGKTAHQVTKDCPLCHGSGKCNTCNGKHWYYGFTGERITCPNCKPNGACSKCGGSGKITVTEWY